MPIPFTNDYARLPERFFARQMPVRVSSPKLIKLNRSLAEDLQLDPRTFAKSEALEIFSGNSVAAGSEPIAAAYAGHQFGHFVPQLGDGRALLLGELSNRNGQKFDVQLKGSGRTPFSRRGDGRAALGPVLREYIVSEAMAALGVPTTRALAAVSTGELVLRETALPGGVLTRVASSHLRVGTFQYFAAREDTEAVKLLADFAIQRHYPELAHAEERYGALLAAVITRQANLVAQWMLLGFVHGVLNTDNTSISGETIDYGPCAFLEAYDPEMVFSSIDAQGRYSYRNQPFAMQWNLARFAECLLPLLIAERGSDDAGLLAATEALDTFLPKFEAARLIGLRRKLGLLSEYQGDAALEASLLETMEKNGADFTLTFRLLCDAANSEHADGAVSALFSNPSSYVAWAKQWRLRLNAEEATAGQRDAMMRAANPRFIPRNHLVQQVIDAAYRDDFQPFETMVEVLRLPYEDQPRFERYTEPARPEERVHQTFCGT